MGVDPDGELAEVAAGFSLDMAVLERAHGVDAVELALRSAADPRKAGGRGPPANPAPPSSPSSARPSRRHARARSPAGCRRPAGGPREGGVEVVAVSGYDPGDRLDGWYDALLATTSAGAPDVPTAARAVAPRSPGCPRPASRTTGRRSARC